eukprot:SAG11_NODE_296_length_11092_cov_24.402620_5_plen_71_part_00
MPQRCVKHSSAGVLSMANAGPDTNSSQFVLTVGEGGCPWFDGEHLACVNRFRSMRSPPSRQTERGVTRSI